MKSEINVAFAGNPNCGKTTLFNAYTGARLKVANWPGVTVEKKEGRMKYHSHTYKLIDLPGTYSLTSYSMEERLTREYLLSDEADVVINVADASSLERNLYLTLQLIELGKPVVLALNMMDIVEERGMEIDLHRLPEMLGIPVVPVSARKKRGLDILMHAVSHHHDKPLAMAEHHHTAGSHIHSHHDEYVMVYSDDIEDKIDILEAMLRKKCPELENLRWYAIKILEHDEEILAKFELDLTGVAEESLESEIINQKYDFIAEVISEVLVNKEEKSAVTDKADRILTHKIFGLPIFFLVMAVAFFLTFTVGDWLKGFFESWIDSFSQFVGGLLYNIGASDWLISLVTDGVVAGVGGVLTFLPNIFILFLLLAFLEDSGYMSRVAYVMDKIMGKIGLSGRAFIPMLLGFGCTVPAIMASRTLENPVDRRRTMLVTPFMSCSAKLPVYVLLSDMFFGKWAYLAAYSMYVIGIFVALGVLAIVSKFQKDTDNNLLIELPEYKTPNARTIIIYVWEKISDYLQKAGTTIFIASVILWFLLNFNLNGITENMGDSFAAYAGRIFAPLLKPAGLGYWQVGVALLSGIAAKEVVVSSLGVLFGASNMAAAEGVTTLQSALAGIGFGGINAYSMMLFCLLYVPCIATIAAIKRESQSWKFTLMTLLLELALAWTVSTVFYQIANLII